MTNRFAPDLALEVLDAPDPGAPPVRPALDRYLRAWRISFRAFGRTIGTSGEYVRRLCLPFGSETAERQTDRRIIPDTAMRARIAEAAGQANVPPESFDAAASGGSRS